MASACVETVASVGTPATVGGGSHESRLNIEDAAVTSVASRPFTIIVRDEVSQH